VSVRVDGCPGKRVKANQDAVHPVKRSARHQADIEHSGHLLRELMLRELILRELMLLRDCAACHSLCVTGSGRR